MKEISFDNQPKQELISPALQVIIDKHEYVRRALAEIKKFDQITYDHSIGVATLVSLIWEKISLTEDEATLLIEASLVHDKGKTDIDPKTLFKKETLNENDWQEIRKHVYNSFQFIMNNGNDEVAKIAVAHHDHDESKSASRDNIERRSMENRNGIDRRENDPQIIKLSRILAIVDNFESLRSKRQYKENFSLEKCEEIISEKFTSSEDREIIKALLEIAQK